MKFEAITFKILIIIFSLLSLCCISISIILFDSGCDEKITKCVVLAREGYCQVTYVNTNHTLECPYDGHGCGPGLNNTEIDCYVNLDLGKEIDCPELTCYNPIATIILVVGGFLSGMMIATGVLMLSKT